MSDKNPEFDAYKKGFEDGFEMAKRLGLTTPANPLPTYPTYPIQPVSPSIPSNPWWTNPIISNINTSSEYTVRVGELDHWGNNTQPNPHVHLSDPTQNEGDEKSNGE